MRKIDLLRELQGLDSALDKARERLEQCRARLGDESELVPLRESLQAAREHHRSLKSEAKDLDVRLEDETRKRKADEKKLYDGSIKNPKELGSLAQEVEQIRQRISHLEDQSLLNMDAMEAAALVAQQAETGLAEQEQLYRADQSALEAESNSLSEEIGRLEAGRAQVVAQLDAATVRQYESIRRTRGGLAVVGIEQRACRGCRISLTSSEVQRARSSHEPATCQNCGRIIYVP